MLKQRHVLQGPPFFTSPVFVNKIVERARSVADESHVISVQSDNTSRTFVHVTAQWVAPGSRKVEKRIIIDRELTEKGHVRMTYMAKLFDPNAKIVDYDLCNDAQYNQAGRDIVHYLRMGILPGAV
jgi:hypothetical protein